eukprot:403362625
MGIKYNLISGFFAAMAAKVGFNFGDDGTISTLFVPYIKQNSSFLSDDHLVYLKYLLHVIFIVIVIVVNGLMLRFYVKSMHENGAAKATVYNFAVNYLSSIAFGFLFFNELVNQRLLLGVVFILSGTFTISTCKQSTDNQVQYQKVEEKGDKSLDSQDSSVSGRKREKSN